MGIKVPTILGGTRTLEDFEAQNTVSYYQTAASHYAKAFEQMGRPVPAIRERGRIEERQEEDAIASEHAILGIKKSRHE